MAKKLKKFLKKAGKAAAVAAALYGATKLGKKASAVTDVVRPGTRRGRQSIGMDLSGATHRGGIIPEDYNINPNAFVAKGGRIGAKGGGIAKRGMGAAFKSGGRVKSMGIAKRGGGAAKR